MIDSYGWRDFPPYLAALVALLGWVLTWRKARREGDLSYAAEARELRKERSEWLAREEQYEERLAKQEGEIKSLRRDLQHLQQIIPLALLGRRILNEDVSADLAWLLDQSGLLWWITSPLDRGHVLWASGAWERLLGCQRADLLGPGWRRFLHPDSQGDTDGAEARAWRARVDGFVNCFVSTSGAQHELRWFAPAYPREGGVTLALALEQGESHTQKGDDLG